MRVEDDNGYALIKEIESKRGGKITRRSFSLFYADDSGKIIENGVFVYLIDDTFWIEDFEKVPSIFGIRISEPKNYRYEKFERSFHKDEIIKIEKVLKKSAVNFIEHKTLNIKRGNIFSNFFGEHVLMIKLKDNSIFFLQMLDSSILKK